MALTGLPLPDEKPQAVEETDQEPEETYVDALNFSLRHNFSDIYVKLAQGDLSLTVQRNLSGEIWSTHPGLIPAQYVDRPFGVCWQSGLTANVKLSMRTMHNPPSSCDAERPEPDYTYVTDENGSSFRFVLTWKEVEEDVFGPHFLPFPSNQTDQETFLMSLTVLNPTDPIADWSFRFVRKFGTTLDFAPTELTITYDVNNEETPDTETIRYYRLTEVNDRMGNSLLYNGDVDSLIPDSIVGQSGTGTARQIDIVHDGKLVHSITDPRGHTTSYTYTTITVNNSPVTRLVQVSRPEGCYVRYGYEFVTELDDTPDGNGGLFYHYNVNSIEDALGNAYQISYTSEESRESYSVAGGWYVPPGQPRIVQKVTLPDASEVFFNQILSAPLRVYYESHGGTPAAPVITGDRINEVVDAVGKTRRYTFSDPKFVNTRLFLNLFSNPNTGANNRIFFFTILWQRLDLLHPTSVTESCEFDGDAGMMLTRLTDYSGNVTTFEYGDTWSVADALPWLPVPLQTHPYFFTKWPDVTAQVNALTGRKEFYYHSDDPTSPIARIMVGIVDEEERVTEYEIDGTTGLRTAEIIMDDEMNVVRRTEFTYGNATFPMFMTEKRVIDGVLTSTGLEDLVTVYTPDAYGNVEEEETGGLTSMTYEYDLNGKKTASIDGRNNRTEMEYDGVNRLFLVTYADTSTKFIGWDSRSKKIREDDENGNITRHEYDAMNRLIKTTRVMSEGPDLVTEFTYNAVGSKLTQKDPEGNVTEFEYDDIQRLVLTRDALNNETVLVYGENSGSTAFDVSGFKPTQATDARGFRVKNTYDDLYRLTKTEAEYETDTFAVTETEYDAVGNPIKVTDPLDSETETDYDALNRPVKVILPDDTEQLTEYCAAEKLIIKKTDELSRETTFQYDLAGRLVLVRQPDPVTGLPSGDSPETVSEYDEASNLVAVINSLGKQWDYTFDERNRRIEELQPAVPDGENSGTPTRPLIVTGYDFVGNVTSVTDPRGKVTTTEYDSANRKIKVTQPAVLVYGEVSPVQPVTETTYDKNGNVLTVTDAEGNVTVNTYDDLNQLTHTQTTPVTAHHIVVEFEYDEVGNRIAQIDGNGCRVEFEYDGLKRLILTRHDAGTAKVAEVVEEYDALLKVARVDAAARRTEYEYDVRHRLTDMIYVSQTVDNRELAYDDVGNLLSVSFPNEASSPRATASTYDKLNRVLTETSAGQTHTYVYDKAGNRTHAEYGGTGRTIDSEYDALNRLQEMDEEASGGGGTRTTTYLRDLSGNLVKKTLPNGTVETRTHDALNRPTEIETVIPGTPDTVLLHQEYEYDRVGNVRRIDESYPGGTLPDRNIVNFYDGTYRLLEEEITTSGSGTVLTEYAYDDGNNRVSKDVDSGPEAGTTTYVIGDGTNGAGANQIKEMTLPDTTVVEFTYDLNGNRLTRDDGTQADALSYDYEQRLVELVRTGGSGAGTYEYAYDARTRRVIRDESGASGVEAKVVFSGGTSVQEYDITGSPALTVEYLRGHDWGGGVGGILYTISSGVESYAHASARGDLVSRTDDTAAITWEAQYEAFGRHPQEAGTNADRQRANSKDEDPTGLLNEGFRYRDLETGTFITRDPAGFVDGPNLYTYVRQNPWTAWDPVGLAPTVSPSQNVIALVSDDTVPGDKAVWHTFFTSVDEVESVRSNDELVQKAETFAKESGRTIDILAVSGHAALGNESGVRYLAMHATEKGLTTSFSNEQLTNEQVERLTKVLSPDAEVILACCEAAVQERSMKKLANRLGATVHASKEAVLQGPDAGPFGPLGGMMQGILRGLGIVEDPWVEVKPEHKRAAQPKEDVAGVKKTEHKTPEAEPKKKKDAQ